MFSRLSSALALLVAASTLVESATVITYPGWRGNNLITNGSMSPQDDPSLLGIDIEHGEIAFPFGMQYMYPCGGLAQTNNRTKWPYLGGALSIQPGWGAGNQHSLFYVNMGINAPGHSSPPNYSLPIVPPFSVNGPNKTTSFTGEFCLPQVPMPVNATLAPGDNVTIQVVQVQSTGQALYNCVDLTLADIHDPEIKEVTKNNCFNSSFITFQTVFTASSLTTSGSGMLTSPSAMWTFAIVALVSLASVLS